SLADARYHQRKGNSAPPASLLSPAMPLWFGLADDLIQHAINFRVSAEFVQETSADKLEVRGRNSLFHRFRQFAPNGNFVAEPDVNAEPCEGGYIFTRPCALVQILQVMPGIGSAAGPRIGQAQDTSEERGASSLQWCNRLVEAAETTKRHTAN